MSNENQPQLLDLNAMANQSLDDIPEAPDFSNPPAGEYQIGVHDAKIVVGKAKDGTPKQTIRVIYKVMETLALADPKDLPVPNETLFSENFQGTLDGLGYFKSRVKGIMNVSDLTGVVLSDLLTSIKGETFMARITIKKTAKEGSTTEFYENVQLRIVHPEVA